MRLLLWTNQVSSGRIHFRLNNQSTRHNSVPNLSDSNRCPSNNNSSVSKPSLSNLLPFKELNPCRLANRLRCQRMEFNQCQTLRLELTQCSTRHRWDLNSGRMVTLMRLGWIHNLRPSSNLRNPMHLVWIHSHSPSSKLPNPMHLVLIHNHNNSSSKYHSNRSQISSVD